MGLAAPRRHCHHLCAARWGGGVPKFHPKLRVDEGETSKGSERGLRWQQEPVLKPKAGAEQLSAFRAA